MPETSLHEHTLLNYGPKAPTSHHEYSRFPTPHYLRGYAGKIEKDLKRAARMYNGREIELFKLTGTHRCVRCTDSVTGEILHSNCLECNGTGVVDSWTNVGSFWAYVDFGSRYNVEQAQGNTQNPGSDKDTFIIIGAPEIVDQDFFVVKATREVFKVYNVEPAIIAMGGTVVAQAANASFIEDGGTQYRVLTR